MPNMWRFNNTLFNSWALWQWSGGLSDIVIFNGFWLLNETYVTTKLNVWNMPSINLLQVSNPKSDWGTLLDRFYKERTITVEWHILAENYEDMQQKIDNLKKALSSKQWYFEFKFWEKYRRILCTLTNSDIINRESYDIDHWEFSLTFRAEKPFRSEKTRWSKLFQWVNDDINWDINNEWSEYSYPIINILVNAASSTNQITITIWDNSIEINKSLSANDIIDINTEEKTVLVNGVSTDFTGKFPRLSSGLNIMNFEANWTFNFDISILFPKNYL